MQPDRYLCAFIFEMGVAWFSWNQVQICERPNQTQTTIYTLTIATTDATGSGNGWNLTITSTQFSTGGATPKTLATTASTITGVREVCVTGSSCTDPTNSITYPVAVPAGSTAPTAVKFFNAATSSGMGKFTVTPTVSIAIPANTFAGSYMSTITLAIVSGP